MTDPDERTTPQGIGVERLRAIRGGHRGVVTCLTKQIDELLAVELVGECISKLNVLLQQLNNKFDKLQDIDHDIITVCKLKEIEREMEESEIMTAKVLDYKRKVEEALSVVMSRRSHTIMIVEPTPLASTSSTKAGLPKITLSTFQGNVTNWTSFWESFNSAVHENNKISKKLISLTT